MTLPIPIAVRVRPKPSWTDERVELLKQLHPEGHSFGTLATMIGGVTRNAVIGKAKRLGLTMRGPSVIKPEPARTPRLRIRLSTTHERKPPTLQSPPIASSVPTCDPVTFAQLNNAHCRYPVSADGAPILFCGADKQHPHPYCDFHANICFIGRVSLSRAEAELRARLMAKERKTKLADPPISDERAA